MTHPATGTGPRSLDGLIAALESDGGTVTRTYRNGHYTAVGDSPGAYVTFPTRALTQQEAGAAWRKWKRRQRVAAEDAARAAAYAAQLAPDRSPVDPWAGLIQSPAQMRHMLTALTLVGDPQVSPAGLSDGHETIASYAIEKNGLI